MKGVLVLEEELIVGQSAIFEGHSTTNAFAVFFEDGHEWSDEALNLFT